MPARAAEEEGFGLIELVFAMVMLNIGILALIAAFQTGAVALARSSATSNGAAVADKVMEVYRAVKTCQIWLYAPENSSSPAPGADMSDGAGHTITNGLPTSASTTWYTQYYSDRAAFAPASTYAYTAGPWVTSPTSMGTYSGITAGCTPPTLPAGSPDPRRPVQYVTGPDGQSYPVFVYVVAVQPSGATWTAGYVKQVTVEVLNPQRTTQVLARETSYFDPNVSG